MGVFGQAAACRASCVLGLALAATGIAPAIGASAGVPAAGSLAPAGGAAAAVQRLHSGRSAEELTGGIAVRHTAVRSGPWLSVRPVKIDITSVIVQRPAPGQSLLVVDASNKGRRAAALAGELRLTNGPSGSSAGPFSTQRGVSLVPGQEANVTFALPARLSAGPWLATVTLTSGLYSTAARATVTVGDPPPKTWSWIAVAAIVTGACIVIALIIVGLALLVRRMPL